MAERISQRIEPIPLKEQASVIPALNRGYFERAGDRKWSNLQCRTDLI